MKKLILILAAVWSLNGCVTLTAAVACGVAQCPDETSDAVITGGLAADLAMIRAMSRDAEPNRGPEPWVTFSSQGFVQDDHGPVRGVEVELVSVVGKVWSAETDSAGAYEIPPVQLRSTECDGLALHIKHPDGRPMESAGVTCGAQRTNHRFSGRSVGNRPAPS